MTAEAGPSGMPPRQSDATMSSSDEDETEDQKYVAATAYWYLKWSTKRHWREQMALNQALVLRTLSKRKAARKRGKHVKRPRRDEKVESQASPALSSRRRRG